MNRTHIDIGARGIPWVLIAPSGMFWMGLARDEEDVWRQASLGYQPLQWPMDVEMRKARGWYAVPATVTWERPRPADRPSGARTYAEWKELGFHVIRGQRHTGRNEQGICTFQPNQVTHVNGYTGNSRKYHEDEDLSDFERGITDYDLCIVTYGD
jgi:hypothetical protein